MPPLIQFIKRADQILKKIKVKSPSVLPELSWELDFSIIRTKSQQTNRCKILPDDSQIGSGTQTVVSKLILTWIPWSPKADAILRADLVHKLSFYIRISFCSPRGSDRDCTIKKIVKSFYNFVSWAAHPMFSRKNKSGIFPRWKS